MGFLYMDPNQTNMYIVRFLSKAKLLKHIFNIAQLMYIALIVMTMYLID